MRCSIGAPPSVASAFCRPDAGGEALAAEDHLGALEAREGEREVVEQVVERRTADSDAEVAGVVKSDKPRRPGAWCLREHHLPLRAVHARQSRIRRSRVRRIRSP